MNGQIALTRDPVKSTELTVQHETELVAQAKESAEGFGQLYDMYYDRIFLYLYRLSTDRSVAEDLTANTFFKVFKKIHKYQSRHVPFHAWLYRIAHNEFVSYCRRETLRRMFWVSQKVPIQESIDFEHPYHDLDRETRGKVLSICIRRLKPKDQLLISLRYYEDFAFKEIAQAAGLTEHNALQRVYRALGQLKQMLKAESPEIVEWAEGGKEWR